MRRRPAGFTLVELMMIVTVIGVLTTVAVPKFAGTKDRAVVGTMTSDLRNLVTAEEGYLADNSVYAGGTARNSRASGTATVGAFLPSAGVQIVVSPVSGQGWSAVATHETSGKSCAIFVGTVPARAPATVEGEPKCR